MAIRSGTFRCSVVFAALSAWVLLWTTVPVHGAGGSGSGNVPSNNGQDNNSSGSSSSAPNSASNNNATIDQMAAFNSFMVDWFGAEHDRREEDRSARRPYLLDDDYEMYANSIDCKHCGHAVIGRASTRQLTQEQRACRYNNLAAEVKQRAVRHSWTVRNVAADGEPKCLQLSGTYSKRCRKLVRKSQVITLVSDMHIGANHIPRRT